MNKKQLELSFIRICNEKAEIAARDRRARRYIKAKENKLRKVLDKILPIAVTMAVISSIVALCIVEYVYYNVFGTLF